MFCFVHRHACPSSNTWCCWCTKACMSCSEFWEKGRLVFSRSISSAWVAPMILAWGFYVLILLTWHRKLPVSAWILALIQQTSSFEYPSVELQEIPSVLDGSGVPSFWCFFLDFKCHLFSAWILPCYSATRALYVSCVGSLFESDFLFMKNTHLTLEWICIGFTSQ